ncbi:MAG: tetratricopeptide repeat protein [Thermodesulfobacteriota bacterium]
MKQIVLKAGRIIKNFLAVYGGAVVFVLVVLQLGVFPAEMNGMTVEGLKEQARRSYMGQGGPRNLSEAYELYLQAAMLGDVESAFIVGGMYFKGQGVVKDEGEAFRWLYKAAEAGKSSVESQRLLGRFFLSGANVPVNYQKAVHYLRMAAMDGDAQAQSELAYLYYIGRGVGQNFKEAFSWFERSARQGWSVAQYNIGRMYYDGQGVSKVDLVRSYAWFSLAASAGNTDARTAKEFLEKQLSPEDLAKAQDLSTELFAEISRER